VLTILLMCLTNQSQIWGVIILSANASSNFLEINFLIVDRKIGLVELICTL
jgi:hypothetical protein